MTGDTASRRAAFLLLYVFLLVTTATKRMELFFKNRPEFGVCYMAIHAQAGTGLVNVIVVTIDAALYSMIGMCERHGQDRLWAVPANVGLRVLFRQRYPKYEQQ